MTSMQNAMHIHDLNSIHCCERVLLLILSIRFLPWHAIPNVNENQTAAVVCFSLSLCVYVCLEHMPMCECACVDLRAFARVSVESFMCSLCSQHEIVHAVTTAPTTTTTSNWTDYWNITKKGEIINISCFGDSRSSSSSNNTVPQKKTKERKKIHTITQ